jgi:CheY-like chemotaxis protein
MGLENRLGCDLGLKPRLAGNCDPCPRWHRACTPELVQGRFPSKLPQTGRNYQVTGEGAFQLSPATLISGAQLSELRHSLRAALKLILSYVEMLIEDASASAITQGLDALRHVHSAARAALGDVNDALAHRESVDAGETRALFAKLRPRAERTNALIDELAIDPRVWAAPDWPQDLSRIRFGADSLLALVTDSSQPLPAEDLAPAKLQERAPSRSRVLIAADNTADRLLLCRRLEREGYAPEGAENGNAALDLLALEEFDLLLLDLTLTGMDGFEILVRLQENRRMRSKPVIVFAAADRLDSVARAIQMGADDYLLKPFHPVLLRTRIGAVLERHRLREELADRPKRRRRSRA